MDYYETFKSLAEPRCKPYFKTVADLQSQLPKVRKRLEAEKANRDNLEGRLKKLEELSMESLSDQNSYEKYKTSMRKLNAELDVSREIIENIEKRILPNAEGRLKDAERNLQIVLYQIAHESRKAADIDVLEPALRAMFDEIDKQQAAVAQGFQDYGLTFVCNDEGLIPGIWPSQEIRDLKVRLGMLPSEGLSFVEVWKLAHPDPAVEPVTSSEPEVEEPSPVLEPPTPAVPLVDEDVWGEGVDDLSFAEGGQDARTS